MFLSAHTESRLRIPRRILLLSALLLLVLCGQPAQAQIGGIDPDPGDPGTGGKSTIQGSIFLPGGRRLDRRAKVKLVSVGSGERFQMSDDTGAFSFRRLSSGTYTITVDAGSEFETAHETVDIIEPARRRGDPGVTIPVYITLQPKADKTARAVGTVDAASAGAPAVARELYKQAIESAKAGDRKKAIEQLKKAIEAYPNFMTALNELGVQYMNLKQYDKAAESLRAALKLAPEAFHPRLNYGILLAQMKDYKAAATELEQAVQKDSSSALAHLYLGRAYIELFNYDAAEKHLQQAASIGGGDAIEAHRYLGAVYIEKQESRRAADELERYLKLAPKAKDADRIRDIIKQLRSQKQKG